MATVVSFKRTPANAAAPSGAAAASSTPAAAQVVTQVPATAKVVTATAAPAPQAVAVAEAPSTVVAVQDDSQVTPPDFYQGVGGFDGEFDHGDFRMPYLSICGKTSKVFDTNPEFLGQFVFNKVHALGTEIRVVFAKVAKFWTEDLPFGSDTQPQRFKRMEDARAAGFHPSQMKETAELDLLIELPASIEGIDELADLIVGENAYLLARYGVQSTGYGATVPILRSDASGFLKGNLINGYYTISTKKIEGKKGTYYVPVLKADGPTTPDLRVEIIRRCAFAG